MSYFLKDKIGIHYYVFQLKNIVWLVGFGSLFLLYLNLSFVESLINYVTERLNYESALKWYKLGLARREQIWVVLLNEDITIFGNGAYSYFDILTGEFNKSFTHFSQYLWFYYDLGVIGIVGYLYFLYRLNKLKFRNNLFGGVLIVGLLLFSMFTIPTFDISFMLTYFIYRTSYE